MKVRRRWAGIGLDLIDILVEKGVVSLRELELNRVKIHESLKPKNIFTAEELSEVETALASLQIPSPTGFSHALHLHAMRDAKENFSPDRVYCESCLINLRSTLHNAGLRNEQVDRKLAKAILLAHSHQVDTCQFPCGLEG